MSVTKFAFLPPNSTEATIPIFFPLTLCLIHPISGVYPYNTLPFTYQKLTDQKEGCRAPNCQTQSLAYWHQSMTVSETMQEEAIMTLSPLFLITDSWLQALALNQPLDSWRGCTVLEAWAYCLPLSTGWELKPPFCFPQTRFIFLFDFGGPKRPRFWPATYLIQCLRHTPKKLASSRWSKCLGQWKDGIQHRIAGNPAR